MADGFLKRQHIGRRATIAITSSSRGSRGSTVYAVVTIDRCSISVDVFRVKGWQSVENDSKVSLNMKL